MKQTIYILALMMALLSSCTTRGDIEQEANEQLVNYMRERARRPDDAKLLNIRTAYKSDSLCILQFNFSGKSAIGLESSTAMEYIFMNAEVDGVRGKYETHTDLEPILPIEFDMEEEDYEEAKELAEEGYNYEYLAKHTVEDVKEKYRDKLLKDIPNAKSDTNIEDRLMHAAALLKFRIGYREVPETKGKDVKL